MKYRPPFLLSAAGSERATAYGFSNKSVTLNGRTHVVWLDRVARVCGRTFDHASATWGETRALFEGYDNHTSPALIADSFANPHLRIIFGPHGFGWNGGQFRWAISENPGALERWKWENNVGYGATYASFVHLPQGVDALAYRGGEWPPSVMFQRQHALQHWTKAREIFRQDVEPRYTHYNATLACDAKGVLYLACHFYHEDVHGRHPGEIPRSHGMAILKSVDIGETWTDLRDAPVALPALYEERLAIPPAGANMYLEGVSLDSRDSPWVLASSPDAADRRMLLSHWTARDWETHDVSPALPPDRTAVDCTLTIDTGDCLHIAATTVYTDALPTGSTEECWAHPSSEIFHLFGRDPQHGLTARQVSLPDDSVPNWLPNISLNGPCQPVEKPVILYTHGSVETDHASATGNGVYCVMIE